MKKETSRQPQNHQIKTENNITKMDKHANPDAILKRKGGEN